MNPDHSAQALSSFFGFLSQRRVTAARAAEANQIRDALLDRLGRRGVRTAANGSKLYSGELSPGCQRCGAGTWSCAYLTKRCTASCFFCPSDPGMEQSLPRASRLSFPGLEAYVAFLRRFGFRGVSFSGGEPLLDFGPLVTWIARIKAEFGAGIYVWVYTNGDLLDEAKLRALRRAGLDEIRVNIRARDYRLAPVEVARAFIGTVTVEIPTIPGEYEILKDRLLDLQRLGVDYLNLHQLFANRANFQSLADRDYTFLPLVGTASPILESEITALRLLLFSLESGLDLPVNYCSLVYRTRYDDLAHRRRAAALVVRGYDSLAGSGYLRRLSVEGPVERIRGLDSALRAEGYSPSLWRVASDDSSLRFHPSLLAWPGLQREMIEVRYYVAEMQADGMEPAGASEPVAQVQVVPGVTLGVGERLVSTPVTVPGGELAAWLAPAGEDALGAAPDLDPARCPGVIRAMEGMPRGLQRIERAGSLLDLVAE